MQNPDHQEGNESWVLEEIKDLLHVEGARFAGWGSFREVGENERLLLGRQNRVVFRVIGQEEVGDGGAKDGRDAFEDKNLTCVSYENHRKSMGILTHRQPARPPAPSIKDIAYANQVSTKLCTNVFFKLTKKATDCS